MKQAEDFTQPLVIDLLARSGNIISANALDYIVGETEDVKRTGKEELLGMPEDQDNSELGIIQKRYNAMTRNSPSQTDTMKDQDYKILNVEWLYQIDAAFSNTTAKDLEAANDSDHEAPKVDQVDHVDMGWSATVPVSMVTVISVDLLSELSCCQSCHQCSATMRTAVRMVPKS